MDRFLNQIAAALKSVFQLLFYLLLFAVVATFGPPALAVVSDLFRQGEITIPQVWFRPDAIRVQNNQIHLNPPSNQQNQSDGLRIVPPDGGGPLDDLRRVNRNDNGGNP
jgi:hypothetical protein